ncbi:hypothetical protein Tco_0291592 [Tanacetum coccineum]
MEGCSGVEAAAVAVAGCGGGGGSACVGGSGRSGSGEHIWSLPEISSENFSGGRRRRRWFWCALRIDVPIRCRGCVVGSIRCWLSSVGGGDVKGGRA